MILINILIVAAATTLLAVAGYVTLWPRVENNNEETYK